MTNKEFSIWCLGFLISFVYVLILRWMEIHPFLEINFTIWICCASLILTHDAIVEYRTRNGIALKDLL